ncbi:hypothetical protein BOTNAR_0010g00630 [Botryotinia narcissicola]|uniref:Uncharacterized protein n=1 Tax=Botryotinia narcissicola TaxID=278944 RepID=A0A4Z1J7F9_9HELO|nr:hypothetical protein BOTNAR_0010g00630 [Botryotinia narcissicola]
MDVHSSPLRGYGANSKGLPVLPKICFESRSIKVVVEYPENGKRMPHEGWDSLDQVLEKKNTI